MGIKPDKEELKVTMPGLSKEMGWKLSIVGK
jgi:hypothetical protein